MAGLYRDVVADVLAGVALEGDLAGKKAAIDALLDEVDSAVEFVKNHPEGKAYHDLHARQLVDGAIAAIMAALLVRFAAKYAEKAPALDYWLATKFPTVRAELAKAKSGFIASVTNFEALAPAVVLAD